MTKILNLQKLQEQVKHELIFWGGSGKSPASVHSCESGKSSNASVALCY